LAVLGWWLRGRHVEWQRDRQTCERLVQAYAGGCKHMHVHPQLQQIMKDVRLPSTLLMAYGQAVKYWLTTAALTSLTLLKTYRGIHTQTITCCCPSSQACTRVPYGGSSSLLPDVPGAACSSLAGSLLPQRKPGATAGLQCLE
jgi:hypothetical protein